MTIRTIKLVVLFSATVIAGGCSNIGSINGYRMNATAAPDATFCEINPVVCVVGAAAVVGGGIAVVTRDRSKASIAPPPAAPTPF